MVLSDTEKSILRCLSEGMQSKEIACAIERSKSTVEGHIRILYIKLEAKSRPHLVARAMSRGILDPDENAVLTS